MALLNLILDNTENQALASAAAAAAGLADPVPAILSIPGILSRHGLSQAPVAANSRRPMQQGHVPHERPQAPVVANARQHRQEDQLAASAVTSAPPQKQQTVSAPRPKEQQEACWSCGVTGVPLKKCSVCTVALYCNAACQKADWKMHKTRCAGLKAAGSYGAKSAGP